MTSSKHPQPRSTQIEPYPAGTAEALGALAEAAPKLASNFARHDGMHLAAICRKL